jgi:hypothetical protein
MSLVPHVQTAIARGFHTFPLTPREKVPLPGTRGFKDSKSPTDPLVLIPWREDATRNIGIDLGASGLSVLDFDQNENVPSWVNETKTYKVKTARGVHVYFRGAQKTAKLYVGDSLVGDLKSEGGYVLAEGSIHPSGAVYTVVDDSPIAELPERVSELVKHDTERVNSQAMVPEGRRSSTLMSIAGKYLDLGEKPEQVKERISELNQERCTPPLSEEELTKTIFASIDRYAQKPDAISRKATEIIPFIGSSRVEPVGTNLAEALAPSLYDYESSVAGRTWDYSELIPRGALCLWLGARKAEKSLFALRKAMHDACGKNWLNHHNCVGPVRVFYFDSENDKADVDERFREIITEFTASERELIQKNLVLRIGKEIKKAKINIEVWNRELFEFLKNDAGDPPVVYLDCWYQLQSIKAVDNEKQKEALELFEEYFPNATIFLLHHTGRESQESLLRKSPACLRVIGAERWSNKSAGGNVLTKKSEVILCQEKYVERDEEGIEGDWFIDFQLYARATAGSILYSFEPVFFGEEVNGVAPEYKFRRKMVVKLSSLAAQAARRLQGKGPWESRYALAKDVGMNGGKQYRAIDELIVKGFIVDDGKDAGYSFTDDEDAIELSAENVVALKTAGSFLDELLLRPDGTPNQGVMYDFIKTRAKDEGIGLASLRKARQRKKVKSEERGGKTWWVANAVTKQPPLARAA